MSTPLIFLAIEVATIVCATLLALRVLASRPRLLSAQLIAMIAFNTVCSVLLSHQEYGYWIPAAFRIDVGGWAAALNMARNLTPGLIMLLCFTLFTDGRRFPWWLWVTLAVQLALEEPARALISPDWPHARFATQTAPTLLQTLFVSFAFYWTVADWRIDLVESRRRTRALTLVVIILVTLISGLLTRVVIDPDSPANYVAHVALTTGYLVILAFVLFRLMDDDIGRHLDFTAAQPTGPQPSVNAELGAALTRLTTLLVDSRVCQQEGLTLKALADRVGLPEYRLRRLVHEQLGYRNFNALLHDYRIRDACRQLSDPSLRRTPILTIALSVGYASVNTFNRGFREIMGTTPSAWRTEKLFAVVSGTADLAPKAE